MSRFQREKGIEKTKKKTYGFHDDGDTVLQVGRQNCLIVTYERRAGLKDVDRWCDTIRVVGSAFYIVRRNWIVGAGQSNRPCA